MSNNNTTSCSQAIWQPTRANKTPTDLGVRGLEATKEALNQKFGPPLELSVPPPKDDDGFTATNWGKETAEERERKGQLVRDARARQMDRFAMARVVASEVFKLFLIQKLLRSVTRSFLGEERSKHFVWIALGLNAWYRWGAPSPANPELTPPVLRLPFLGALVQMALNKHRFHNFLMEKIGMNGFKTAEISIPGTTYLAVMDARDREYVLKTNFRNYLKNRENDFGGFEYVLGDVTGRGIFSTDKIEWLDSRKIASHMFSGASLKAKMEDVFNHHADEVVRLLETRIAGAGKAVDMQEIFQSAIFDAFCEIAFGYYPNATSSAIEGKKPPFLVAFDTCQAVAAERFMMPPLIWHLQRMIGSLTGLGAEGEFARSAKMLDDYVRPIIEERLRDNAVQDKTDLLSLYINHARETNQQHMLEFTYLRDTIINFMIAGRDTTSCTLAFTTRFVGEHPEVEQRLLNEAVLPLAAKGDKVTWDDSRTVPYADATFNEVLRLAPPVGDDMRTCIVDDVWPSGVKVKAGTRALITNLSIGRDPFLWENPEKFDPERWMAYDAVGAPQPVRRVDEYVYPVFFSGRRLCLGKDMARFESIVFMTKIFSKLKIKPLPVPNYDYSTGPVIFLKAGNLCMVERRDL